MLEAILARHAAPTLAGLKTASLFAVRTVSYHALAEQAAALHQRLCKKGVCVWLLGVSCGRALVYVCRPHRLQRDLSAQDSRSILRACGYRSASVQGCLLQLGAAWRSPGSFRTKSACFWAIRLAMCWAFYTMPAGTANSADTGRCMAMCRRRWRCLPNTKNVPMSMRAAMPTEPLFGSSP